ncbi:uncharacterized protein LOC116246195 [Nymphaea colorata]|uniref:uncharacterized protein LOC116246195 n=1 Tax=Nymphaea colorata TaxID=210225 RepID=UPI00129E107F|nr:uncharacterized protein LOC116246195 [Nymphaea colorata]
MAAPSTKNKMRPYKVLILLVFTAAVAGVMVLNKVKDKQAHDILIREKDGMIKILNLRYEREKAYSQELQSKVESMRAKIESLKTHKAKLNSKLIELQSVMTALKEKRKILGTALEKKQKKITSLKEEKSLSRKLYAQLVALKETLKQKEDEIHELKRLNGNPSAFQSIVSLGTRNSPTNAIDTKNATEEAATTHQHSRNKKSDDSERRQDETIVLVTNFDARENPRNATEEPLENQEANATGIDSGSRDSRANTPHKGNITKGHGENLGDTDINHNKQEDDVKDDD